MINEQWLPLDGYEGYEVSNLGRVRSLDRIDSAGRQLKGKILRPATMKNGYLRVELCKEGKRKKFYVHRLVGQAFIPNPKNLSDINHKDENKTNNRVENLEWCSRAYNNNYGTRIERVSKPVSQFTTDGKLLKTYPSVNEAAQQMEMKSHSPITCVLTGRAKTAYGFIWRYAGDRDAVSYS